MLLYSAKSRAKRLGLPFDLDVEDLVPVPMTCEALGLPLNWIGPRSRRARDSSPSLDRKNPSLGYVRGNIKIISWRANSIRWAARADELAAVARYAASIENDKGPADTVPGPRAVAATD
jgi:hypothetical protein